MRLATLLLHSFGFAVFACIGCTGPIAVEAQDQQPPTASSQAVSPDLSGVWSGTLFSNHSDVAPFTVTVVITKQGAHFAGNTSMNSECLRGATVQVKVSGTTIVLAGSNEEGDNVTIEGTLDSTGKVLEASYILNGSATGSCETDDGQGQLAKR